MIQNVESNKKQRSLPYVDGRQQIWSVDSVGDRVQCSPGYLGTASTGHPFPGLVCHDSVFYWGITKYNTENRLTP